MPDLKFLHTSDLQLGMRRWFLSDEDQANFDAARLEALTTLGQLAEEHGAEFIVIAGDVFEHNSLSNRVIERVKEQLRRLKVPVYLLPGNHDPLVADNVFLRTEDLDGVHVLSDNRPVKVREGVEVVGAPWRSKAPVGDLVAEMLSDLEPTDNIRIGVAHGQVESRSQEIVPGLIDLETVEKAIAERRLDYLALGDTHSTQSLGATGRVWFSGAPETTDFAEPGGGGEADSGNALLVTVQKGEEVRVDVDKLPMGRWTFEALADDLYDRADVDAFLARLDAYPEKTTTVIKYALTGTLSLSDTRYLHEELSRRADVFGALYERVRLMNLHLQPGEEEIEDLELGGVAGAALQELLDDREQPGRQDAINLLFRLAQEVAN
ncbi:DNA repair exonuclease [Corynebacterium yudongzhengii]|uniref:Nuclease SbcCD subunit D n=1 Tax=Corynebacterium yudongzhengii TaxID=2080740 RepID=A0A2U1T9G5_9CORY|nr:exonuclease SbcCD subunit D [Corynebacterium yudongzhengii]AWB82137.1 DNA repair exonuclease [Corynebacterium yudongzhengii]PWC02641.1 exonuclease SbcCD subunit D [Corynebacterium yudongzhengii]